MSSIAFFAIPKALNTDLRYQSLSVEAKYLYGYLRDRHRLSVRNGWRDRGGVFVYMARKSMAELLHRSLPTIRKIVRELVRAGLLVEKRQGLTHCNKLYVQPLPGETETGLPTGEKRDFSPEGKAFSTNKNNPSKNESRGTKHTHKSEEKRPIRQVLAQQYTQREYSQDFLQSLIAEI